MNPNNVFVIVYSSFEQNNIYFLHALQEAMNAFNSVLHDFGFYQNLEPYYSKKHPTQPFSSHLSTYNQLDFPW